MKIILKRIGRPYMMWTVKNKKEIDSLIGATTKKSGKIDNGKRSYDILSDTNSKIINFCYEIEEQKGTIYGSAVIVLDSGGSYAGLEDDDALWVLSKLRK